MQSITALATDIKSFVKHKRNKLASHVAQELSMIISSMQSGNSSRQELQRINIFFKDKLLPLYQVCTDLTLQLSSKLLEHFISHEPILGADADEAIILWNSIPGAIATGILDFLEVDKNPSTRTLVARHFYGAICPNYFPDPSIPRSIFDRAKATTLTSIYQLLSDSVAGHPENQSKLRNSTNLGGFRIGLALARLQDLLAIEALLELFANLLPSAKVTSAREKRTQFVKEVFDRVNFPNYEEILKMLDPAVISDWGVTSQKISDLIALRVPSYPQPLETKEIIVGGSNSYNVERVYIDNSGFLASIDEGDSLGTLQLPYRHIEQLSISEPLNGEVVVTVSLKKPPILNQQVLPLPQSQKEGKIQCTWTVKVGDAEKMIRALRHRNLDVLMKIPQKKMSLAGTGVELLDVRPALPSQTKAKDISSLWSSINPTDATSPLLSVSRSSKIREKSTMRSRMGTTTRQQEVSNSGSDDLSSTVVVVCDDQGRGGKSRKNDIPVTGLQILVDNDGSLPDLTDSDPALEDSPSQIVRRVTRQNRQMFIIKSDAESESPTKSVLKEEWKNLPVREIKSAIKLTGVRTPAETKRSEAIEANSKSTRQTRSVTRALAADSDAFQSPLEHATEKHKRPESESEGDDNNRKATLDAPPAKRPRVKQEQEDHVEIPQSVGRSKVARLRTVKKYRAKVKNVSPTQGQGKPITNFDAIPKATKTVATKMKTKDGKVTSVKPRPVKPRTVKEEVKEVNLRDVVRIGLEGDGQGKRELPSHAKEARAEGFNKKPEVDEEKEPGHKKPQKQKKAPWDDPAFIAQVEMSKSEFDTGSMQISEFLDHPVPEIDDQAWETSSPHLVGREAPMVDASRGDVEMIDLTKDDSPLPEPQEEKSPLPMVIQSSKRIPYRLASVKDMEGYPFGQEKPVHDVKQTAVKTSVDIGVQAGTQRSQSITPKTRPTQKPSKIIPPVTKSPQAVQPLMMRRVSQSTTTYVISTPLLKGRLDRKPSQISRPPTVRKLRNIPAAPSPKRFHPARKHAPETVNRKIVDVLNEINEVILQRVDSKLEGVRNDLKMTQQGMLAATRERLGQMHSTSAGHYNTLVELYEKYATERRENLGLFDEIRKAGQEALDRVANTLLKHSRQSLSKKFPKAMFINVPPIIRNPKPLSVG